MNDARAKHHESSAEGARKAFSTHLIREQSDTRWLLYPREGSNCWTEVIALTGGGIFVGGDIGPVVFRYGPKHPVARVHWMGRTHGANDRYFREKAHIGMGGDGLIRSWRWEVAMADIDDLIDDLIDGSAESDEEHRELVARQVEELREIQRCACDSSGEKIHYDLYDTNIFDGGDMPEVGYVPSTRLYHAHAALARLSKLLDEQGSAS